MGNQHSGAHITHKTRKNVHWKSAGRPAVPGKPEIIPISSEDEPNAVTLRWQASTHDGGAPLLGYQVECQRLGSTAWVRTAPPLVLRPELVLTGLEPPHRYQFRVAAVNGVGRSEYSELSAVLTVSADGMSNDPPIFLQHLNDVTALENDKTEFRVSFVGTPTPTIAWFKDDYEIFSSRRTAILTTESTSVLVFHQTLASDEGEIKCTATNKAGHAVTRARICLEAAPKLRYPRQYEDGLLYEINETVFLKTSIVGKPTPTIEWRHDGQLVVTNDRVDITNNPKFSMLKIHSARRSDRGEYQIHARNDIGEDTASFLVTVTAPPEPPRRVTVARQLDKSVALEWYPPEDDGGCRIGNYVVEYYRTGWNVWLKATTSRKTGVTLFDLIEGSEYRFRVKAESPYGMSNPSEESPPIRIPGRSVDMEFLAVESRIISDVLVKEDGEEKKISPAPRRRRSQPPPSSPALELRPSQAEPTPPLAREQSGSNEFMLVLYPDTQKVHTADLAEKRKSFQLDLEDSLSPPVLSLSAPDLSERCVMPFKALRHAVSSTELLHERAMARFYRAVALEEEQSKNKINKRNNIPHNDNKPKEQYKPTEIETIDDYKSAVVSSFKAPQEYNYDNKQSNFNETETQPHRWQSMSFDEDYTASTVSSDGDFSDDGSMNADILDRKRHYLNDDDTYNPRDKTARISPAKTPDTVDEEDSERETIKPLPDPNFIPKPILKRREPEIPEIKPLLDIVIKSDPVLEIQPKPKKEPKMTIFKKITTMPVQSPFPFPKLNIKTKKQLKTKSDKQAISAIEPKELTKNNIAVEKIEDKFGDEGRTVIEHYGNIVKEYGSSKKPATTLYLNTEDLKNVAEKQVTKATLSIPEKKPLNKRKPNTNQITASKPTSNKSKTVSNSVAKQAKPKQQSEKEKPKSENKVKGQLDKPIDKEKPAKLTQQIVLKTTERATIIIPIDYGELEEKAKINVRSAIDYMVDLCLLGVAFWVYLFKDERLAIPLLVLIIYRQLRDTFLFNIPQWVQAHTPTWIKRKMS